MNIHLNSVIGGYFNTILRTTEKRGPIVRDPFRDRMEDITDIWDMLEIIPKEGKYTWSKRRTVDQYIAAHLGQFFIHSS